MAQHIAERIAELTAERDTLVAQLADQETEASNNATAAYKLTYTAKGKERKLNADQQAERSALDTLTNMAVEKAHATTKMLADVNAALENMAAALVAAPVEDGAAESVADQDQDQDAPEDGAYNPLAGVGQPFPDGAEDGATDQDAPADQGTHQDAPPAAPVAAPAAKALRAPRLTLEERNALRWAALESYQGTPDPESGACHWCNVGYKHNSNTLVGTDGASYHKVCADFIQRTPVAAPRVRAERSASPAGGRVAALELQLAQQSALLAAMAAQLGISVPGAAESAPAEDGADATLAAASAVA